MLDERTRQMIEYYLPNPPDPDLEDGAYYWLQEGMTERILKVYPLDTWPMKDGTEYGLYTRRGGRLVKVDAGYGDPFRGARKCDLYDNRQDCKDHAHNTCEDWEQLREIQRKEGLL